METTNKICVVLCYDHYNICDGFKKLAISNARREAFNKFRIYFRMTAEFEVEMVYMAEYEPLRGASLNDQGRGGAAA